MRSIFTFLIVVSIGFAGQAQEVEDKLNEASAAYKAGNLENARFALQQALTEINQAIGREILALLPEKLDGMQKVELTDDVTGTGYGFAGLFVSRNYQGDGKESSIEIISDSPLMAGINALLSMPVFLGASPDQKRIKIDNYKALMTRNQDAEGVVSWDIQMPFSNSMLSFRCSGIDNEKEVTALANQLPVEKIVKLAR
ncbi:MAG: hypothetical protein ACNA7V_13740 [Bacteroidales bacterium]